MTSPKYPAGEEWVADQLIAAYQVLIPAHLATMRADLGITAPQLPDPVSYWPEQRFGLAKNVNLLPAVMVHVGQAALLGRTGWERGVNVEPVTVPAPSGGPIQLWRYVVTVTVALSLDTDAQQADPDLAATVDDWTLTSRLKSRYALATKRSILGTMELVPDVLVVEENGYTTPESDIPARLQRRYAESNHQFTVLTSEVLGLPALGYVDPAKIGISITVLTDV